MNGGQNSESEQQQRATETFQKTETVVRRVGYVVFFGAALLVAIPMVVSAIQGIQQDRIWDPFTGAPVTADDADLDCIDEAADLAYLAGEHQEFEPRWEQRYRRWGTRCQQEHQDLYKMLSRVREQLRGTESAPAIEDLESNTADGETD